MTYRLPVFNIRDSNKIKCFPQELFSEPKVERAGLGEISGCDFV